MDSGRHGSCAISVDIGNGSSSLTEQDRYRDSTLTEEAANAAQEPKRLENTLSAGISLQWSQPRIESFFL
jgi:hypothetical protein